LIGSTLFSLAFFKETIMTENYNIGETKDGDTIYISSEKIVINHADGTQTVKFRNLWQRLKSIVQKFKSRKPKTINGKTHNSSLRIVK
jgi:hypothetical protein